MVKAGNKGVLRLAVLLLLFTLLGLCLSACDDGIPPDQVGSSVATARALTNSTPAATVSVADEGIGISVSVLGIRTYYPDNPNEKVSLQIYNSNNKTFYVQTCQSVILQREDPISGQWTDIAPDVPCPPRGPQIEYVGPNSTASADFVFKRTVAFAGQKMDIPGTYHLNLTYYVDCAPGGNTPDTCVGKRTVASVEFPIAAGTGGAVINATPTAASKP